MAIAHTSKIEFTVELDENKIILKELNDICGGIEHGDCEFGLLCRYESQEDEFGTCVEK